MADGSLFLIGACQFLLALSNEAAVSAQIRLRRRLGAGFHLRKHAIARRFLYTEEAAGAAACVWGETTKREVDPFLVGLRRGVLQCVRPIVFLQIGFGPESASPSG